MTTKQILLGWLAEDDLNQVLRGLFALAAKYKDEHLSHEATLQSARWKALEKQRINDTISHDEDTVQAAKIRYALTQIIEKTPAHWTLDGVENQPVKLVTPTKANWKKYAAYLTATIALLGAIAEFSGYSLRDIFSKKKKVEQSVLPSLPAPKVSTQGDQSPAIITHDGDVNIHYGEPKPKTDSTAN